MCDAIYEFSHCSTVYIFFRLHLPKTCDMAKKMVVDKWSLLGSAQLKSNCTGVVKNSTVHELSFRLSNSSDVISI